MRTHKHYLTTKEVAAELGVAVPTIYKYVKEKKLTPIYQDKWQIDETLLFRPESVADVKEKFRKPGLTTGEAAKRLGIHPTTLAAYIKQGRLRAEKHLYKGRSLYFIEEEALEAFRENHTLQQRKEKKRFYSKEQDLYLYQTLIKENDASEVARIMELDEGKVVTEEGRVFPLADIHREGYVPRERFLAREYMTKRGYAVFEFEKPSHISSPVFTLLELFYREAGYKNIRLLAAAGMIRLEIKPLLLSGLSEETNPYEVKLMHKSLVEGSIAVRHNGVLVDSDIDPLVLHVPSALKEEIRMIAASKNTTMEAYILNVLKAKMKNEKEIVSSSFGGETGIND